MPHPDFQWASPSHGSSRLNCSIVGRGHHKRVQPECNISKILPPESPTNTVLIRTHVGVHTQATVVHHQCTPCPFPLPELSQSEQDNREDLAGIRLHGEPV
ncbi:unnamed protein product [Linum trigynum]|uniref:Uncharacterized protein n=1 Tax=Linum trigynum TaxID=586398 RepID=A0AAV2F9W3_9ROSI